MMTRFQESLSSLSAFQIIENGAVFFVLILALVMFFRSSSPFNKYFIPVVCIAAAVLRILHWAQHGNEPEFMTPLVTVVAGWLAS